MTLDLSTSQEGLIGNATVLDMTLKPGMNEFPLTATIDITASQKSLNSSGFLEMLIDGKYSVYNGVHLTYYEAALAANQLSLPFNILQILKDSM